MRIGPLGLSELLLLLFMLAVVVGVGWFLVASLRSLVINQRLKREALERNQHKP